MSFGDKFKSGDIICSDRFHNGLCMIVQEFGYGLRGEPRYKCIDLIKEDQGWLAYEVCTRFNEPYNWRIATDDDIVNYLARNVHINLGDINNRLKLVYEEDHFRLTYDYADIFLSPDDMLKLKDIIEQRVG